MLTNYNNKTFILPKFILTYSVCIRDNILYDSAFSQAKEAEAAKS